MPVYVDELIRTSGMSYAHLIADTEAELLVCAGEIGLRPEKSIKDANHNITSYVISWNMRINAIRNGAKTLNRDEYFNKLKEVRENIKNNVY